MKKKWGNSKLPPNTLSIRIDQCSACLGVYKKLLSCSAKKDCNETLCLKCIELGFWVPLQHSEENSSSVDTSVETPVITEDRKEIKGLVGLYCCHKCIATTMNQSCVIPISSSSKNSNKSEKSKKRKRSIETTKLIAEKGGHTNVSSRKDFWMCVRCTFANKMNTLSCKICSASKPAAGSSRRPKANRVERLSEMYGYNASTPVKRRKKAIGRYPPLFSSKKYRIIPLILFLDYFTYIFYLSISFIVLNLQKRCGKYFTW